MYLKYCFLKFNKPPDSVMAGGNTFQSLIITYCDLCCFHLVLQNGNLIIDLRLVSWISWAALTLLNKKSISLLRALNTKEQRWNRLLDDNETNKQTNKQTNKHAHGDYKRTTLSSPLCTQHQKNQETKKSIFKKTQSINQSNTHTFHSGLNTRKKVI